MKYVITKEVKGCRYWIQEISINDGFDRVWNGLIDNARVFSQDWSANAYLLRWNIRGVIQKIK
jgi:hypothetical protein